MTTSNRDKSPAPESPDAGSLTDEQIEQQQASDLPAREAMSLLTGVPSTAAGVPLPLDSVNQPDIPTANPGGVYDPNATVTSTSTT